MADELEIGVTIPIPAPWRRLLALLRTSVGDPLGAQVDPHVTLLPPTRIADADLLDVARHVAKVAAETPAFRIGLAGSGTFRPVTEVVYVPLVEGAPGCAALAALLRSGPIEVPLEHPYSPHVTAAHNIGESGLNRAARYLDGFTAAFTATEILLSARPTGNPTAAWTPPCDARTSPGAH
jgi:2'-5' RNA ligase